MIDAKLNIGKEKPNIKKILSRYDVNTVLVTLALFVVFAFFSDGFLSSYNVFNISRTAALYIFIALSQAMVILVGGMNLSVGTIGGLSTVIAGLAMDTMGFHPAIAIGCALLVGVLCGLLNGYLIVKLKLNSFVVTLATQFIFQGLVFGISKGFPYTGIPESITVIGRGGINDWIPYLLILAVVALAIVAYIFKYKILGRNLLATGGNKEAAQLSGIKTDRMIVIANVLSGLFAAMAAVLWITRMGSAQPGTGVDWMIISFAVAVIGGTSLDGGVLLPLGILASSFMIAMIKNGLVMVGVNVYLEQSFLGLIILFAVSIETFRKSYEAKKLITKK